MRESVESKSNLKRSTCFFDRAKMSKSNPSRDLPKSAGGTTPVGYRDTTTVYRSLAAVPSQLQAVNIHSRNEKATGSLVGPQSKSQGEVLWTDAKVKLVQSGKEAHPVPIPLIVPNAPQNAFCLESNPLSKVVTAVNRLLEEHDVDMLFNAEKFKWKCACYEALVETRFVCRLYSIPEKEGYFVLDFQRRSGDPFHFQSIYKAIHFKLLKSGFVVPYTDSKNVIEPEFRTFKPMALPADFFSTDDQEADEKNLKEYEPLCKMCTSSFIDVQREGLGALACHVEQSESARRCLVTFAEKLIEAVALSRDDQVKRLATSSLAAISIEKSSHSFIKENGGLKVLTDILLNDKELLETRRQAGKALVNVGDLTPDLANSIKGAHISRDARLLQIVKELNSRLTY